MYKKQLGALFLPDSILGGVLCFFVKGFVLSFLIRGIVKYLIYSYYWCAQRTVQFLFHTVGLYLMSGFFPPFVEFLGNIFPKIAFFLFPFLPLLFPFCVHVTAPEASKASNLRSTPWIPKSNISPGKTKVKDALLPISCVSWNFYCSLGGGDSWAGVGAKFWRGEQGKRTEKSISVLKMHFQALREVKENINILFFLQHSWVCVVPSWLEFLP